MKVLKIVVLSLFVLTIPIIFFIFANYMGLFSKVFFNEETRDQQWLLVEEVQGNYSKTGIAIQDVKDFLKENNIECIPTAIFYDDPSKVIKKKLRGAGGCSLKENIQEIPSKFKMIYLPETKVTVANIQAYPAVAIHKVFPAIKEYTEDKNLHYNYPIVSFFKDGIVKYTFITDQL